MWWLVQKWFERGWHLHRWSRWSGCIQSKMWYDYRRGRLDCLSKTIRRKCRFLSCMVWIQKRIWWCQWRVLAWSGQDTSIVTEWSKFFESWSGRFWKGDTSCCVQHICGRGWFRQVQVNCWKLFRWAFHHLLFYRTEFITGWVLTLNIQSTSFMTAYAALDFLMLVCWKSFSRDSFNPFMAGGLLLTSKIVWRYQVALTKIPRDFTRVITCDHTW